MTESKPGEPIFTDDTMNFEASWDTGVWLGTTFGVASIFFSVVVLAHLWRRLARSQRIRRWLVLSVVVVLVGIFIYAAGDAPRSYTLEKDAVIVKQLVGRKRLVFGPATHVIELKDDTLRGGVRLFGSGGLLGYFGTFQHRDIGTYYMAATRRDNRILIRDSARAVIVTPDDPGGFVREAERWFSSR